MELHDVMTQAKSSDTSRIIQWASHQLAHYDARYPDSLFAEGVVLDAALGYELQSAVAQLHRDRGERPSAGELIGHNTIHAGFVFGEGVNREDARGDPSLEIFADDRLLDECDGPALIQTLRSSLSGLMEIVRDRGDRLGAGQIILTGSIPSLIRLSRTAASASMHRRLVAREWTSQTNPILNKEP